MKGVTRLYRLLLRLYPPDYRGAFGEEMADVFTEALSEAQQRGRPSLWLWCGREFVGLLAAIMRERWLSLHREEAIMKPRLVANHAEEAKAETPRTIIAGVLPFILFGLMFTLKGVDYHMPLAWVGHGTNVYLLVHAILVVGLGIGWALHFPRWSYGYLGTVVITSFWLEGVTTAGWRLLGYTTGREQWGWRAWVPLMALTAIMLLATRSLRPLAQVIQGIRRDWTRLSFALYAALTWLFLGVTYDGKTWYGQTLYLPLNLFLLTLAITAGAYFYLRLQRPWPRVLALPAALILYLPVSTLITALDGRSEFDSPALLVHPLFLLLIWLMWLSVPIWPGVAHDLWRRLRPV